MDTKLFNYILLGTALSFYMTKEVQGEKHNETILDFWKGTGLVVKDDETAWCAAFVSYIVWYTFGIRITGSGLARAFLKANKYLVEVQRDDLTAGDIMVFSRTGSPIFGHVGFKASNRSDVLDCLGGNQSNMVSIVNMAEDRFIKAFRIVPDSMMVQKVVIEAIGHIS